LPRFDLLAQINEVEARQEEYTESLAFLGLVNALLEGVGQGGLPAGGTAVGHYTALVLQYIAGSLWQRGYRCVLGLLLCVCCLFEGEMELSQSIVQMARCMFGRVRCSVTVNAVLQRMGQGGLPAGGTAVGHYTALVLQYIAGSLWQRGYRYERLLLHSVLY
jgi:hypothetical protein